MAKNSLEYKKWPVPEIVLYVNILNRILARWFWLLNVPDFEFLDFFFFRSLNKNVKINAKIVFFGKTSNFGLYTVIILVVYLNFSVNFTVMNKRAFKIALILLFQQSTWVTNSVKNGTHVTLETCWNWHNDRIACDKMWQHCNRFYFHYHRVILVCSVSQFQIYKDMRPNEGTVKFYEFLRNFLYNRCLCNWTLYILIWIFLC